MSNLFGSVQVVSDIDDTLMCSGGHFPAGSDLRYPRNCVYPGILAFYRGLDTAFASRIQVPVDCSYSCCSRAGAKRRLAVNGNKVTEENA